MQFFPNMNTTHSLTRRSIRAPTNMRTQDVSLRKVNRNEDAQSNQPSHKDADARNTTDESGPPCLTEDTMKTHNTKPGFKAIRIGLNILIALAGIAFLPFAQAADTIQKSLGYSREFLRGEQRNYGVQVERAAMELNAAQDRLTKGMSALAERNVLLTMLYLDDATIRIEGHEQRVAALRSSPLSYSRAKQIELLFATYADLRAKERRLEDSAFELLNRQPAGVTNSWKSLPLYLSKRADFASRFKDQAISAEDLAGDIQLLQDYPLPLVIGGLINQRNYRVWTKLNDGSWRSPAGIDFLADGSLRPATVAHTAPKQPSASDPTTTALKQLERKTSELNQAVNQLRQNQSNLVNDLSSRKTGVSKETPIVAQGNPLAQRDSIEPLAPTATRMTGSIPMTDSAVNASTPPVASITITLPVNARDALPAALAAPANVHQTNPAQSLTASVTKTNETPATVANSVGGTAGNSRGKAEQSTFENAADTTDGNAVSDTPVTTLPRMNPVWLISAAAGVLVLVVAVILGLAFANRRQSEFEMSLACGLTGQEESITLAFDPTEQCVVLGGERPSLEVRGAENDHPSIIVRHFGGPQLRPSATTEVRLNGEPISKAKRLCVGDVVQVTTGDRSHNFTFQGGNFVSAEEPSASFESATTTIN